jgi:uncharacterized protein YhaN
MKIAALEIDGYGVWSGLKVERLSDGINVLYGPNEAGKTTLLHFVRSVLYGFSPQRRRYFPPVRGGRPGGWIEVAGPNGRFQIDRHDDAEGQLGHEQLTLTAADGTCQGEHMIKVLLSNIDETIFNNIFAVGLREMQELGTLSDTEAAALLYNLSAGLDRVSLVETMRELETSRNRILDRSGSPCQVVQLLADREKLRQEIEELDEVMHRYGRLAAERNQLDGEITRLEEEKNRAEYQARVVDLALGLRERWTRRTAIDDELAALGPQMATPADAIPRLDALNARLQKHQHRLEELQQQRADLRREGAGLTVQEALRRQAPRIEALQEQEPWINTLQGQVAALDKEIAEIDLSINAECQRLGLEGENGKTALPSLSSRTLAMLRSSGRAVRHRQERLAQAQQAAVAADAAVLALSQQIDTALSTRQDRELPAAIDRAGNLIAQLRRHMQIDDRLEQMTRCQRELEDQGHQLLHRQLLPVWVLAGLGAAFVLGVVLILAGLFLPASMTGSIGWVLAVLGLAGCGAAGAGKLMLERANARQLDASQKQLNLLQLQLKQTADDRDALDGQLPHGSGPMAGRLAAAEKDLAALEELMPVDTRRTAARQDAAAAKQRATQAEEEHRVARRRWRELLQQAGLPPKFSPRQVKQLLESCDRIGKIERRLAERKEELGHRRGELDSLLGRIAQLVGDAGIDVAAGTPAEQLRQLADAVAKQEAIVTRREAIRQQLRQIGRDRGKREEAISRLKLRRRELLRDLGANDEPEFRRRAVEAARADVLRHDREAVEREITTAIAGYCPQEAIRQHLEGDAVRDLETCRDELLGRWTATEKELQQRFEKRGQLAEQAKALAEDRRLGHKQLELAVVEKRLEDAMQRWQVLAVTCRILEAIRSTYEQQRQPETLQEASGYLERLTQGRYCRVWTPLGENVLRVDDADGHALPVEVLSRGTREQLFLSLRLALAACYARRGAPLPLVLDDVLVNFDSERAKAAAIVLRDFAAAGHQVLVFTCHEHMLRLFKSLKVPTSRLPDNAETEHATIVFDDPAKEKPKRSPKALPAPRKTAARIKPSDPEDESEEEESDAEVDRDDEEAPWEEEADEEEEDLWQEEPGDEDYDGGGSAEAA